LRFRCVKLKPHWVGERSTDQVDQCSHGPHGCSFCTNANVRPRAGCAKSTGRSRTPLTAIIGFAETLSVRWPAFDDERSRDLVERIGLAGVRLDPADHRPARLLAPRASRFGARPAGPTLGSAATD
jgi:hypothetical protein